MSGGGDDLYPVNPAVPQPILEAGKQIMLREQVGHKDILSFLTDSLKNLFNIDLSRLPIIGGIWETITGIVGAAEDTFASWIGNMIGAIQGINPIGAFPNLLGLFNFSASQSNSTAIAAAQAVGADAAAKKTDRRVDALFGGGIRTIYTSDTLWVRPENLEKIVVITCGAGRKAGGPPPVGSPQPGAVGGGWVIQEIPAAEVPATVPISVAMPPTDQDTPSISRFGTLVASAENASGVLQFSTLIALEPGIRPGASGQSGYGTRVTNGSSSSNVEIPPQSGYSTALAAGGQAPSGAGGNAPMDGPFLAGGAGGAGGRGSNVFFGPLSNGGAGGFPGGASGPPGRSGNEAYCVPGIPAQGFVAVTTYIRKDA